MRRVSALGAWAVGGLVVQAALAALAVGIALVHGPGFDDEGTASVYPVIALLQALVFVAAGIVVLVWIYRTTANVGAFGAENLSAGPKLAVASYFIPIVNLVMPFQAMRDVWKASVEPRNWEVVKTPPVLGWWWLFWLVGNILGLVSFRLTDSVEFPEAGPIAEKLLTASDVCTIAASLLLATIVRRVTALQQARVAVRAE